MNSSNILYLLVIIPLAGFVTALFLPRHQEKRISVLAYGTSLLNLAVLAGFLLYWIYRGRPALSREEPVLFHSPGYDFRISLYVDVISAVYLLTGALLFFLIISYSRYYMHREPGFKRFFTTLLFFYSGYTITVLAGNFETLFIGWEYIGISSFLLVAFYRERYLPVRNAMKLFAVYRIGDVCILLAMWGSHHLWHRSIAFRELSALSGREFAADHNGLMLFVALMFLVAASVKSAQFPFSYWLPKAMEGPTTSSAVFYGSLSVHFGAFLLLRTFPFWQNLLPVRVLVGLLGLVTAVLGYFTARVQSTVKSQVAYASLSQIGLIFIEIAAGYRFLALLHFSGNAFLRTYQLLISPSAVGYLLREQFYTYRAPVHRDRPYRVRRLQSTLYVLAMKEWNMERLVNRLIFAPLKKAGRRSRIFSLRALFGFFVVTYLAGLLLLFLSPGLPPVLIRYLPGLFSLLGLVMVLRSFTERGNPFLAWSLVVMNHCWVLLAFLFNGHSRFLPALLYLSGIVPSGIAGLICLYILYSREKNYFDLNRYYGHIYEYRKLAMVFLLSALGLMGFPLTLTFVGEDLIFSNIHSSQPVLALFNALGFIFGGISLIRIYARLFTGPHIKTYHPTPSRSS